MPASDVPASEIHMAGSDHLVYGDLSVEAAGALVAAMSVGAGPDTPSMRFKGDTANEDALSGRDDGRFARLVVADSHFGNQASELLVRAVHAAPLDQPTPLLLSAGQADDGSETTFTSLWLDRERGVAQARWCGDSLALLLRPGQAVAAAQVGEVVEVVELVDPEDWFVTPQVFDWHELSHAEFAVEPGDVLLTFTDGVNECHYRQPETSVTIGHIAELFEQAADLHTFVQALGELALAGIDDNSSGNPGGQDNIAIVAVRV